MNKLKYFILLCPLFALGQPVPPAATQTEVNAGLNRYKYVTPFTLANTTIVGTNAADSKQHGSAVLTNLTATGAHTNALTPSRAAASDGSGVISSATTTLTELNYVSGVSSAIQTQIDGKQTIDTELTEWSGISTNRFLTTNHTMFTQGISNNVRVAAGTGGITVTPSGSGGIMTYTINDDDAGGGGGGGGTNFPAVLLQVGNTNLTLQAGKRTVHSFSTNGNYGVDADLAVPASGHVFSVIETNSAATNYTVTFYTNGVAATFYDIATKTNATSWVVPLGSVVENEFLYTAAGWFRTHFAGPELAPVAGTGITFTTNGVNGRDLVISATGSGTPGGSSSAIQFNEGSSFAGTNRLMYDRAANDLIVVGTAASATNGARAGLIATNTVGERVEMHSRGFSSSSFFDFSLGTASEFYGTNVALLAQTYFAPAVSNSMDSGLWSTPWKTNYANQFEAKVGANIGTLSLRDNSASNIHQLKFKAATSPAITTSNILINFNTNRYFLTGLTNAIFTNLIEETTGQLDSADVTVFVKNTTAVAMGLVWPAYGAQHGYFIRTNANNPVISTTTLAAGAIGVAAITMLPDGTNMFMTFTTWP